MTSTWKTLETKPGSCHLSNNGISLLCRKSNDAVYGLDDRVRDLSSQPRPEWRSSAHNTHEVLTAEGLRRAIIHLCAPKNTWSYYLDTLLPQSHLCLSTKSWWRETENLIISAKDGQKCRTSMCSCLNPGSHFWNWNCLHVAGFYGGFCSNYGNFKGTFRRFGKTYCLTSNRTINKMFPCLFLWKNKTCGMSRLTEAIPDEMSKPTPRAELTYWMGTEDKAPLEPRVRMGGVSPCSFHGMAPIHSSVFLSFTPWGTAWKK